MWRLKKSLYGLKQAARAWHAKMDKGLGKLGFTPTSSDPSIYIKCVKGEPPCIIATHVDDSLQIVKGALALKDIKSHLADTTAWNEAYIMLVSCIDYALDMTCIQSVSQCFIVGGIL